MKVARIVDFVEVDLLCKKKQSKLDGKTSIVNDATIKNNTHKFV